MQAKVVLLASGDLGCKVGQAIVNSKHNLVGVVSPPPRPKGRGRVVSQCPVGKWLCDINKPCLETTSLKKDEAAKQRIIGWNPDIVVVADFGQIISKDIIDLPKYGCINVHPSILPKYRGAAPVNWAIINGDKTTGVTILFVTEKLDAGDIILQKEIEINNDETSITLAKKLYNHGASLLIDAIEKIILGKDSPITQEESKVMWAPKLEKESGLIDWSKGAKEIVNLIRGLLPWPGSFTFRNRKRIGIEKAFVVNKKGEPGIVVETDGKLIIAAGDKAVEVCLLKPEGKKIMEAVAFVCGYRPKVGEKWGEK